MEILRIPKPTLDEFAAAAEVCELRWSYLKPLHTRERFEAFQKMGVELIAVREGERFDGVCFVLPCRFAAEGESVEWVSLFQLATRPETKNIGGIMMMKIMSTYPAVIGMGVTAEAEQLYKALRWRCYSDVWRGVHPIDLRRMAADYGSRLRSSWQRIGLRTGAGLYNALCGPIEALLALGSRCRRIAGDGSSTRNDKSGVIASYLDLYVSGERLQFVNAAGIGRILSPFGSGLGSLSHHASAWRQLRQGGAKFCEVLLASETAKGRAMRLGYFPVRMPLWYRENNGMVSRLLQALKRDEISFLHTDKSV